LHNDLMHRLSLARGPAYLVGVAALLIAAPALSAKALHHKPKAAAVKADTPAPKADDEPAPKPADEAPPAPETKAPVEPEAPPPAAVPAEPEHQPAPELDAKPPIKADEELRGSDDEALGRHERMRLAGGHTEVGVSLGAGIGSRHFTYSDPVGKLPRPYNLGVAPMASFGLEAYPLATSNVPVLQDLGIVGHLSRAFALDSKTPEGAKLQTSWTRFGGELRERLIVPGPHTLEVGIYGGADASYFVMSTTGKVAALLPTARAVSLRFGFDARLLVAWRLSLLLGGAYLDTTSPGEIYDRFRHPRVAGVDGAFGCAIALTPGFEMQLAGRYTRYFATFKPVLGDADVAGGALDEQVQLGLGVRYAH
jgi:hypothetical protein